MGFKGPLTRRGGPPLVETGQGFEPCPTALRTPCAQPGRPAKLAGSGPRAFLPGSLLCDPPSARRQRGGGRRSYLKLVQILRLELRSIAYKAIALSVMLYLRFGVIGEDRTLTFSVTARRADHYTTNTINWSILGELNTLYFRLQRNASAVWLRMQFGTGGRS